jgi:hypothetical protein
MLFKKDWVDAVLDGRKRQTVRLKQPRIKVGRTYAVQTSYYSPAVGRIRITAIRQCTLGSLTQADIRAEGWPAKSRDEFDTYFATINHLKPNTMTANDWRDLRAKPLWCIDFEPTSEPASEPSTEPASESTNA